MVDHFNFISIRAPLPKSQRLRASSAPAARAAAAGAIRMHRAKLRLLNPPKWSKLPHNPPPRKPSASGLRAGTIAAASRAAKSVAMIAANPAAMPPVTNAVMTAATHHVTTAAMIAAASAAIAIMTVALR